MKASEVKYFYGDIRNQRVSLNNFSKRFNFFLFSTPLSII